VEREPVLSAEATFALGGLGVLSLLLVHLGAWFFFMFNRPSGGFHHTTFWTFIFFAPEAVVALGIGAALAIPGGGRRIFTALWLASVAALVIVLYLYASHPAGRWSLPVVPPFGGGAR
jgi:uncharacterized membrane protein